MQQWIISALIGTALTSILVLPGYGIEYGNIDISVQETPEHQIRYTSGNTIYVESLQEGQWCGRYWTADGRINWNYDLWSDAAFGLEIQQEPDREAIAVTNHWEWVNQTETDTTKPGTRHTMVELSNSLFPLRVQVHTVLDGTPVLTRRLVIRNDALKAVALTKVWPWSTRCFAHTYYRNYLKSDDRSPFNLGYFTKSDWGWEGWFDWKEIAPGRHSIGCDKGQGYDDPFFIIQNRAKGEYLIGHLAWSANWTMEFNYERKEDPGIEWLRLQIGPAAKHPQRVIAPGEEIQTPAVHLGLVTGDLDEAVQAMHKHIRRSVIPSRNDEDSYLLQYLVPSDNGYLRENPESMTEKTAIENIDLAAALGAELFILDAGWWDRTLDWEPSAKRFPNGLEPAIAHAREKGLRFGLYAEIEGGRGNIRESRVAREHPDWLGPKDILILGNPECAAWVEKELRRLIERYDLDLFRLDYNPLFTYEGPESSRDGFTENNYWRYYEAFYGIFERIHQDYPDLILQQCAGGGARNDLGTASRFHESYLTDGLWFPNVLRVFSGLTMGFPPEHYVTALGAYGQPTRGRIGNLDTQLRATFTLGTPLIYSGMVAPNLAAMPPERLKRFKNYAQVYKEFIRPVLPGCMLFHHAPISARGGVDSSGWFAMEFGAPDQGKDWALIARIGDTDIDTYSFIPRGLSPNKRYQITLDSKRYDFEVHGWDLINTGIKVRLESIGTSELLLFEEAQ